MDFTNENILQIAMQQSAIDANCQAEDFLHSENVVALSAANPKARKYLSLPFNYNLISYGNNIIASINEKHRAVVTEYIDRFPMEHCFETPSLHVLNDALQKACLRICFMAEYFLPDLRVLRPLDCPYQTKLLHDAVE